MNTYMHVYKIISKRYVTYSNSKQDVNINLSTIHWFQTNIEKKINRKIKKSWYVMPTMLKICNLEQLKVKKIYLK